MNRPARSASRYPEGRLGAGVDAAPPSADGPWVCTTTDATPPATGPRRAGGVAHVYRCWDYAGRLVYVGRSTEPEKRWYQHGCNAYWPRMVARREVGPGMSLADAKAEELRVIREERPLLNITGNPDYTDLSRAGRAFTYHTRIDAIQEAFMARDRAA